LRHTTFAAACLAALAAGSATALAATSAPRSTTATAHRSHVARTSPAVRALRGRIRATRAAALRTAYSAAMRMPRHGRAERRATTVAALRPILVRWQGRLHRYRQALVRRTPALRGLRCIHRYEGPWAAVSDSSPAYYGGLQMDRAFERAYGADVLSTRGGLDANRWSVHDQLMVGMRAYHHVGYSPWPTTAAACGLS
jgi:hypothetical protein